MATGTPRIVTVYLLAIAATGCSDRNSGRDQYTGHTKTVVAHRVGKEQQGTVVPWESPSAFEIEAMAKLKTMLSPEEYDILVLERETNAIAVHSWRDPEVARLYEQITEDRIKVLKEALANRKPRDRVSRRRRPNGEKPPAL